MAASKSTRPHLSNTTLKPRKRVASSNRQNSKSALHHSSPQSNSIYEQLHLLNSYGQKLIDVLDSATGTPGIPKRMAGYYKVLIREACSLASQDILESMDEIEINASFHFSGLRKQYENRLDE